MSGDKHLKFGAKDFDSLAQHVQGMIEDLQDGVGMANSKDGSFGDDALADKVDLFEKHWHQQAKPGLIDHLGKLKKHIETSRDEFVAHERKLAAAANSGHTGSNGGRQPAPAPTPTTTPAAHNAPAQHPHKAAPLTEAEKAQAWYAYDHGYTHIPPTGVPRPESDAPLPEAPKHPRVAPLRILSGYAHSAKQLLRNLDLSLPVDALVGVVHARGRRTG